jgi:hypothetical protein
MEIIGIVHSGIMKDAFSSARGKMNELLAECTESQKELFSRMYPKGVSDNQLDWAIRQIENTLKRNKEKELPN